MENMITDFVCVTHSQWGENPIKGNEHFDKAKADGLYIHLIKMLPANLREKAIQMLPTEKAKQETRKRIQNKDIEIGNG